MSAALHDDEATELALNRARQTRERGKLESAISDLERAGVRGSSLSLLKRMLERHVVAAEGVEGETTGGLSFDAIVEAYQPELLANGDLKHDRAQRLKRQLESGVPITLDVHCMAIDGRHEAITFSAKESKAYLEATLDAQSALRTGKIRERRLSTAIAAAQRLIKESGRRAAIEARITVDEELCLTEFGALTTAFKSIEGSGGKKTLTSIVRDGWLTNAREALKKRKADLDPVALREDWGYDFDQSDAFGRGPVPFIGGVGDSLIGGYARGRLYGPNQTQMTISEIWDEQAKARDYYERDVFCKQGINISSDFVLGRGVTVQAGDDTVQAELDDFMVRHPLQQWKKWFRSSKVMGEIFLREVPLTGGKLQFQKLPAQTIWAIVTESEDITVPLTYVQRYNTAFQMFAPPGNDAHYVERLIPADEVLHYKRNATEDEVRGRSDAFSAFPWHHRYNSHWDAQIEKDFATAAYAYVAMVDGPPGAVRRFINSSVPKRRPKPGQWHVFNQHVKSFDVVESDKTLPAGAGSTSEGILNALAASYGFPKEYFGVSGNRSRGGAVVAEGPAQKSFEDDQDDLSSFMELAIQRQLELAQAWGRIPLGADLSFNVEMPEIIKGDSTTRVEIGVVMRAQGAMSAETFGNLGASELDLGDTYDFDQERVKIKAEAEQGITVPGMPPSFDPIDAKNPTGAGANPALPDPRSGSGSSQIRNDDQHAEALDDATDDELAAVLAERGATVILR